MEEISRAVVQMAIDMVDNPHGERVDLVLPTELVVRNSCLGPRR
jgi:DNA-binding LacI/PurR family transcriptional regulator